DEQVKGMREKKGYIHVVFNPPFINEGSEDATISELVKQIDRLCSVGGEMQIGLGSVFDGISTYVPHWTHAGEYQNLINELMKHYSEEQVRGFAYQNFLNNCPKS